MSVGIQEQNFGVEYEFTGITREKAAKTIATFLTSSYYNEGGSYDKYVTKDSQGRTWTVMSDGSISKVNSLGRPTGDKRYSCELVTPVCKYEDIEKIQQIVRELKAAGARVNDSCGIHIHIDGANHNAKSIRNLSLIIASKEAPMRTALEIKPSRATYCQTSLPSYIEWLDDTKNPTLEQIKEKYYEGHQNSEARFHYSHYRYHMLNLHSFFGEYHGAHKTVEFRCFNSTQHAGKMKAYIQFCLAVSSQAIRQTTAIYRPMQRDNDAYVFRTWLNRAKLIGPEYKTCRTHMLANLQGDLVYHDRANVRHRNMRCAEELNARIQTATAQQSNPSTVAISELPTAVQESPDVPSFSLTEQVDAFIRGMQLDNNLTVADRSQIIEILSRGLNNRQQAEVQRTFTESDPERQIQQAQQRAEQRTRRRRTVGGGE